MRLMQFFAGISANSAAMKSILAATFLAAVLGFVGDLPVTHAEQLPEVQAPSLRSSATKVKALYLTGWTVGIAAKLKHYVELAKTTEINAYVVDIKGDDGYVGYESQVPLVREIKAWFPEYKVETVIRAFHDNGIRVIGRIVCFKDPVLSSKKPDLSIKDRAGKPWKDDKKRTWLDPYNSGS
jgi:hypothetical protein